MSYLARPGGSIAMDSDEILQTINSFPNWLYEFNLKGHLTPVINKLSLTRFPERKNYFFDPLVDLLGGSLKGKRVLDIGCNAGFYSLLAIENGCDFVMGIDGRQMHIDQASFVFKVKEIEESRYHFVVGNIFDIDLERFGTFDIVFCLGIFHHFSKQMQFLEKVAKVNSDILLIETRVSRIPGAYMAILPESTEDRLNALDYSLVMLPTKQAVLSMVQQFNYQGVMLRPQARHKAVEPDYKLGRRRAFLCSKKADLSKLSVEVEETDVKSELRSIAALGVHWLIRRLRKPHLS
jgi:2-polyprenyl-3-methyl-5-hydroxy-6-metoxy-1,4-benzoquinol methylase